MEYLALLGPDTVPGRDVSLSTEQMERHKATAQKVQSAYRLAAEARPEVELVPIANLSREHALGSQEPWAEGFSFGVVLRRKAPFHPNAAGMRNVADRLYERLQPQALNTT